MSIRRRARLRPSWTWGLCRVRVLPSLAANLLHRLIVRSSEVPHCRPEMAFEPFTREPGHLIKCSRFFKQMGSPWDDHELFLAAQFWKNHPVQLDDLGIVPTNDEQRWRSNARQGWSSQVGAPAAGDNGTDHVRAPGRCH